MGTANDPVYQQKLALDIKYGKMRSQFNSWRTQYSKETVIEIVMYTIDDYKELPASVRRDYKEEAAAFIETLGDNFFHGEE